MAGRPSGHLPFDLTAISAGLVFTASLPELQSALHVPGAAVVVQAPPGTGKTTLVPPLLANLFATPGSSTSVPNPDDDKRVVVTQPRRVAVRSAARRLAALDLSAVGGKVGYTVRGERRTSAQTVVEFVTPGILLRRLLTDPGLETVAAVVLDEVHERGLETDLLLAMLAEVRQLRPDLTLVAMSATLDAPRFAALMTDDAGHPASVVDCPSALFPLEVIWSPAVMPRLDERGVTRGFLDHVADVAARAHAQAVSRDRNVDALVFAPGAWEVGHIAARIRTVYADSAHQNTAYRSTSSEISGVGNFTADVEVLELHGQVDAAEQDRAISGRALGGLPRIIVSTSLAESSLTVPGVRLVIDSGLSREPRRDAARGMSGLVTVSCSRASAQQRAGRAARLGPGTVVRCYDERAFAAAPAHQSPEIAVADLTQAALMLACWGAPDGRGLRLPDAPPRVSMEQAVDVLFDLGAVDGDGYATSLGKALAALPADPRLGRALLEGTAVVGRQAAAQAVALLSGDHRAPGADLTGLLTALRAGRNPGSHRWKEDSVRLARLAGKGASKSGSEPENHAANSYRGHDLGPGESLGFVVALAYPDRVARNVAGSRQYLLSSGTRSALPAGSTLQGQVWLAIAEVSRASGRVADGTGAVIRSAAPLSEETAIEVARHLLNTEVKSVFQHGKVSARQTRSLGSIVLSSTPVKATIAQARGAVARALESDGLGILNWSASADGLRRRMALLHRELGEPWPDVSERGLLSRLEEWLAPALEAIAAGKDASKIELKEPLRRLLPWPEAARLDELVPERLTVPSGSHIRIAYPPVEEAGGELLLPQDSGRTGAGYGQPVVAVKLQECFGWAQTPRLVGGRVPILFHLLSPAGRPLAVTGDLASFWAGPYAQVRAEMRGRYPKHPWPQDPWSIPATAKLKSKGRSD